MLIEPWRITLCGALTARQGSVVVSRFRTQKSGLLLAYLALYSDRAHSRDELADRFWFDSDSPLHSLRMALSSLRGQLEPPGVPRGSVLTAGRSQVQLTRDAFRTDVAEFRAAVASARAASDAAVRSHLLRSALSAASGDLLPGSYMEWALEAREEFAEQVRSVLQAVVALETEQGNLESALVYARRMAHLSPLEEEAHIAVIRLLLRKTGGGTPSRTWTT